jgi:hypothetical protein
MKWKLRCAGANSKETAKKPEELHISHEALEKLEKWKVIKKTEDGRYYVPCKDEKYS